jgi:hypothetical protein
MISTYCIDIDNTICYTTDKDYRNSKPIFSRIDYINNLYDSGNIIKYFTARGMGRFDGHIEMAYNEFYELTKSQLSSWGCRYQALILGKPSADFYIDDKNLNLMEFFNESSK